MAEETNLTNETAMVDAVLSVDTDTDTDIMTNEVVTEDVETSGDDDFENIFLDAAEDETAGEAEEAAADETPSEVVAENTEQAETLTAKYNGQEFALDKASVVKLAQAIGINEVDMIATLQKGMNYDNFKNSLPLSNEYKALDLLAEAAGMSRNEYISGIIKSGDKLLLEREINALREKYPYIEEEDLHELAQTQLAARKTERAERAKSEANARQNEQQQQWAEFFKKYPDKDVKSLSPEMFARVKQGENPIHIQLEQDFQAQAKQIQELQRELDAMKKNRTNAQKAMPSIKSDAADSKDDFLAGFLS